tara:strand:+ start:1117 stop:1599 length:483 start_codon:yes stop_codon:yes gene_type:complete
LQKIELLNYSNINLCADLVVENKSDLDYFHRLGWSPNQINDQINKNTNFSFGFWESNILVAFILGNLIAIEKFSEYEILILYVDFKYRKIGKASSLINYLSSFSFIKPLNKISLEVSKNNIPAINLYKKNGFYKIGERKNYYNMNNIKENALIFEKKINK